MRNTIFFAIIVIVFVSATYAWGQDAGQQALLARSLKYKPIQSDVEYDIPAAEEEKLCELIVSKDGRSMMVKNPQKITIRFFNDADGDEQRRVDQWSYYQNGVEVYRELDTNGNGKQDQFRWLNSAGTRWGIDENEDRVIDYWKEISAEEVSREIVLALATNDVSRLLRVALNEGELKSLALGETLNQTVAKKISALKTGFDAAVKATGLKGGTATEWYQLNAVLPGVIPSGDRGNEKDLVVYENAMTTISDGGEAKQIAVGTLVKIGDNNWRVLDLPKIYDESQPTFTFIQPVQAQGSTGPVDNDLVALMNELQEIQSQIPSLPKADRPAKHKEAIARLIQIIAKCSTEEERENWIRQLADTIMEATGRGEYPEGSEQMAKLFATVNKPGKEELAAHVLSRQIMIDYYTALAAGGDNMKAYSQWLENLEEMVTKFEKTEAGIEGMMQLASYREMGSESNEEPLKWYTKIAENAAGTPNGLKARGAVRRLNSEGKIVPFKTTDSQGGTFDIAELKGQFVLLVFWDASSEGYLPLVNTVTEKFATSGLRPVGINLDADVPSMQASVAKAPQNWRQLYAPGGLDSQPAVYWGISTPPYMILYDKEGKVAKSNVHTAEELQLILTDLTK